MRPVVSPSKSRSLIIGTRPFRFGRPMKRNPNEKVGPAAKDQKIFLCRISTLDAGVVFTVSVEACAAVPLIVIEVGFRLHVGMSLTFVNVVVTLQVRSTTP